MQTLRIRDVFMKMPNKGGRPPPPAKNRERQTREERKAFLWKGKQDHKLANSENDLDCIHNYSTLQTIGETQKPKLNLRATLTGRVQRGNSDFSNGISFLTP
jgi:hypothetical protein